MTALALSFWTVLLSVFIPLAVCKPAGIINIGNSCYMNIIIQSLHKCPPVVEAVYREVTSTPGNVSMVLQNLALVFGRLSLSREAIDLADDFYGTFMEFSRIVFADQAEAGQEEDALVFFNTLMELIPSSISDLFRLGESRKQLDANGNCILDETTDYLEPFIFHIPLIRGEYDVQKSLDAQVVQDPRGIVETTRLVAQGPLILMRSQKNTAGELFDGQQRINFQRKVYALSGHDGQVHPFQLMGLAVGPGHYYAVLQTDPSRNRWLLFNDDAVHSVKAETLVEKYATRAIMFLYMRQDIYDELNVQNKWVVPVPSLILSFYGYPFKEPVDARSQLNTSKPVEMRPIIDAERRELPRPSKRSTGNVPTVVESPPRVTTKKPAVLGDAPVLPKGKETSPKVKRRPVDAVRRRHHKKSHATTYVPSLDSETEQVPLLPPVGRPKRNRAANDQPNVPTGSGNSHLSIIVFVLIAGVILFILLF